MKEGCLAEAGEVDRQDVIPLRELRPDRHPVQGAAAEAMDHQQRLPFTAKVDVMDRPVEIYVLMAHCVKYMRGNQMVPSARLGSRCPPPALRATSPCGTHGEGRLRRPSVYRWELIEDLDVSRRRLECERQKSWPRGPWPTLQRRH